MNERLSEIEKRIVDAEKRIEGTDQLVGKIIDLEKEASKRFQLIEEFIVLAMKIFEGQEARIKELENSLNTLREEINRKRTISEATTEQEKPIPLRTILDEWMNGEEAEHE